MGNAVYIVQEVNHYDTARNIDPQVIWRARNRLIAENILSALSIEFPELQESGPWVIRKLSLVPDDAMNYGVYAGWVGKMKKAREYFTKHPRPAQTLVDYLTFNCTGMADAATFAYCYEMEEKLAEKFRIAPDGSTLSEPDLLFPAPIKIWKSVRRTPDYVVKLFSDRLSQLAWAAVSFVDSTEKNVQDFGPFPKREADEYKFLKSELLQLRTYDELPTLLKRTLDTLDAISKRDCDPLLVSTCQFPESLAAEQIAKAHSCATCLVDLSRIVRRAASNDPIDDPESATILAAEKESADFFDNAMSQPNGGDDGEVRNTVTDVEMSSNPVAIATTEVVDPEPKQPAESTICPGDDEGGLGPEKPLPMLNDTDEKIMQFIRDNPGCTQAAAATHADLETESFKHNWGRLREHGWKVGPKGRGCYPPEAQFDPTTGLHIRPKAGRNAGE